MSPHTHTPASSRRFLPPSTISRDPMQTPAQSKRPPRFAPSSQTSSSTRFSQTPQFKTPSSKVKDDIETSFEETSSSPPLPLRSRFTQSSLHAYDPIDDVDENVLGLEITNLKADNAAAVANDLSGLIYLEKIRGVKAHKPPIDPVRDFFENNLPSLPHKRQRLSTGNFHVTSSINISPSLRENESLDEDPSDDEGTFGKSEYGVDLIKKRDPEAGSDDDMSLSPVVTQTLATSRFRMPTTMTNSPRPLHSHPLFKPSQFQRSPHLDPSTNSTLPDAFSPSRRRGKLDYIPTGAAQTVRSWVLSLAAGNIQSDSRRTETLNVAKVTKDKDGRCAVVENEEGTTWLLIGQQGRNRGKNSMQSSLEHMVMGKSVALRGASTRWTVDLGDLHQTRDENVPIGDGRFSTCSVSVLWDLGN